MDAWAFWNREKEKADALIRLGSETIFLPVIQADRFFHWKRRKPEHVAKLNVYHRTNAGPAIFKIPNIRCYYRFIDRTMLSQEIS